jgi:hypothetical protein
MHPGQGQSYSADEGSQVQPDHTVAGDFIAIDGRLLPRVRGGESDGGAPAGVADPAAGGGGEGQGDGPGLYDLTTVPEHLRPAVEPHLKQIEANVTQRFQEAADFRKQWEPFSGIEGLADLQPDAVKELVEFHRDVLSQGPDALKAWWTQIGEHAGWAQEVSGGDAGDDDDDDDLGGDDSPAIADLRGQVEQLTSLVEQLVEGHQAGETEKRTTAAKQAIESDLEALAKEHLGEDKKFDDKTRDAILTFALRYPNDDDAVRKGYADLQGIKGEAQSSLVEDKLEQPAAALRGGAADTAPAEITSFAEAKRLARERAKAAVGT